MKALLLCDDLMFSSRLAGAAQQQGVRVEVFRDAGDLVSAAQRVQPRCVVLDLDAPGLDIAQTVADLRSLPQPPKIIGYGPHVRAELLAAARDAGCDLVLPRSQVFGAVDRDFFGVRPGSDA